ncbi:MAG: alpha/beta hydrolase-fold protein, partial [Pseudomonadota bacterium]
FQQFKFTRGSWESVEQDENGFDIANRFVSIPADGPSEYEGTVARWRNVDQWPLPNSTVTDSVQLLDLNFDIPQLDRTRRIWIYLPPDYDSTQKRYPVLYMMDGQNVFDTATSFAGEWGVDEALDELHGQGHWGAIVVAVANGEASRADEYHPYPSPFGGGEGDLFLDFLVDTLKPYVDANYRTLTNARSTGVGGSSSAGLFSGYAGLRERTVFGRVLSYSPAFFANPEVYDLPATMTPAPSARFAFVSGLNETVGSLPPGVFADAQDQMIDALGDAGVDVAAQVLASAPADGTHSEAFWRREFPGSFLWLFPTDDADADGIPDLADNCTLRANADQRDSNGDGFGNACDADFNDDGVVNVIDLGVLRQRFFSGDLDADLNGDGVVNIIDLGRLREVFFTAPGPSAIAP